MKHVHIKIDGREVVVPDTYTILEAAKEMNIFVPTLCYYKELNEVGCCRMCVVEVKGAKALQAACVTPVSEGMEVYTFSSKVREARKFTLELILSNHDLSCPTCSRTLDDCELQLLAGKLHASSGKFEGEFIRHAIDEGVSIVRDPNKCILCRRCVSACRNTQSVSVIDALNRGFETTIGAAFGMSLADTPCVNCGQCIVVCPVGALHEKSNIDDVYDALGDPEKYVVVQTAPAVRAALGEPFGLPIGTDVTGKMVTALKMLGFDKVFDTDVAADLTIMEEANEFIDRVRSGGKLPLITSCSPGWIKFCEHNFPDLLDNLSSCKSPHTMFGAIIKSYFAKEIGVDPKNIVVVSIMPCTAKKFEITRPEMEVDGIRDVDIVLTTRELAKMIAERGIRFAALADEEFDSPFGLASGAGHIFGASGGVMEAALRTAADILTGTSSDSIEYEAVRGMEGIKKATVNVAGIDVKLAAVNGLGNARKILEEVRNGEVYHFIEIMACPGGCINGGGQPIKLSEDREIYDIKALRAKALYSDDRQSFIRKSHKNPDINKLYKGFLGAPGGTMAHHLLHTHYHARDNFPLNEE